MTRHEATEEALRESSRMYEDLVSNIPVGVYRFRMKASGERVFDLANKSFCELTGLDREDILNDYQVVFRIVHPDDLAEFISLNESVSKALATFRWEGRAIVNGETRWMLIESSPTQMDNGDIVWTGYITDITDLKRAEEDLKESEEHFRLMFEKNEAIMLLVEPDSGAIVDANDAAAGYYGYQRETLRKMRITDINCLPPDEIFAERQRAKLEERNYFVFPHRLSNGETRTVEVYSYPIYIKGRTILFSIVHDVTQRNLADKLLSESREQLALAIEGSGAGLWDWRVQTGETIFNERWAQILG
jgi:PAS domain S-box-containing protein